MRGGASPWWDFTIDYPRSRLEGLEISHINVVNPGDSAKRASPDRRADFSHVNARLNPALLVGL